MEGDHAFHPFHDLLDPGPDLLWKAIGKRIKRLGEDFLQPPKDDASIWTLLRFRVGALRDMSLYGIKRRESETRSTREAIKSQL